MAEALMFGMAFREAALVVYLPLGTACIMMVGKRIYLLFQQKDNRWRLVRQILCIFVGFFGFAFIVAPLLVLNIAHWLMSY